MTRDAAALAERARQFAGEARADRPAWLCVAVAIGTTKTAASARKVLAGWDGPAVVRDRAVELLNQLEVSITLTTQPERTGP